LLSREEDRKEYRVKTYERRQHNRIKARNNAYVIFPTTSATLYGFIVDISRGGICFEYIPLDDSVVDADVLDIILSDTGRRFNSLPFQSISDTEIFDPCYSPVVFRRRAVKFIDLTPQQQSDLENFIHQNLAAKDRLSH